MKQLTKTLLITSLMACSALAQASIVRVTQAAFTPQAGLITFSEFAVNTVNPTYAPINYGGGAGAPTVTFDGYFAGQSLGAADSCPSGAALTGCVVGTPTGTLTLEATSPNTRIVNDAGNQTSPVLSGSPIFNGPIAILFSVDVAGVGLDGGFFDAIGGTAITAYARNGSLLGSVTNTGTGIEFLGLVTSDGTEQIAGLLFSLVGSEPAGFGIDNLRFGTAGQVTVPGTPVPAPGTLALAGLALLGLGALRVRRT